RRRIHRERARIHIHEHRRRTTDRDRVRRRREGERGHDHLITGLQAQRQHPQMLTRGARVHRYHLPAPPHRRPGLLLEHLAPRPPSASTPRCRPALPEPPAPPSPPPTTPAETPSSNAATSGPCATIPEASTRSTASRSS